MSRIHRIIFEILAPVPLGAIVLLISSRTHESLSEILKAFPVFLIVAYTIGIVPSVFYALTMEIFFRSKLHQRFGFPLAIFVSALSGLMSGLCIHMISADYTQASGFDILRLAAIGSLVGLIIGFYIALRSTRRLRKPEREHEEGVQ